MMWEKINLVSSRKQNKQKPKYSITFETEKYANEQYSIYIVL